MKLLELSGVASGYGPSQVLFGVDLAVEAGATTTLLGRNGMGKTTTLRTVFGLLPLRAGSIRFDGESIAGLAPDAIARRGLAIVPEGRAVFPNLSVHEHLLAFAANHAGAARPWTAARVYELFPALAARRRQMGAALSGGEQQMLAIGRALVTNPRLLILDEATEGLAPLMRATIWQCLQQLRAEGQAILIVDKHVDQLVRIADHHWILERGRVVWSGASAALAAEPGLWHRYLGV